MIKGRELFCVHCWKRTEVSEAGAATLQTHSPILSLTNHLSMLHNDKTTDNKEAKVSNETVICINVQVV